MSLIRLALANLLYRKLSAFISIILLVFGVALVSLLLTANRFLDTTLVNSIQGVDMVVGAKGSPMQLILANIYHLDNPTGNIPLKQVDGLLRNPLIEKSVKLSYGDYYQKYRILGASQAIYPFYQLKLASGQLASTDMQVVIGANVAKEGVLKIGDSFESAHGEGSGEKHGAKFKVVGILAASGTIMDGLIITPLESIWNVHGHEEDPEARQITAVLVKFKSPMGIMTIPAMINKNTTLMSAVPSIEVNRLLTLFEGGFQMLYFLSVLIIFIALLSVFFSLLNSLRERKFELALMRLQGASRAKLFMLISLEAFVISLIGSAMGIVIGRIGFALLTSKFAGGMESPGFTPIFGPDLWLVPVSIIIGFVAALLPAINACRVPVTELLREK